MTRIKTVQGTGVVWEGKEGQTHKLHMIRMETVQGSGVVNDSDMGVMLG